MSRVIIVTALKRTNPTRFTFPLQRSLIPFLEAAVQSDSVVKEFIGY
jgi:hypothetical protein